MFSPTYTSVLIVGRFGKRGETSNGGPKANVMSVLRGVAGADSSDPESERERGGRIDGGVCGEVGVLHSERATSCTANVVDSNSHVALHVE